MDAKEIKGFIPIAVAVLVFLLSHFFAVKPLQQKIREYSARSKVLEDKIKKDVPEAQIQKVKRMADSTQAAMDQIEARILESEKLFDVGFLVGQQAKAYRMELVAVKPDYTKLAVLEDKKEEIHELPMKLELKGYFKDFTTFWDAVSGFPFAMKVKGIQFLRETMEKPVLTVEMDCIFFFREIKAKGEAVPAKNPKT